MQINESTKHCSQCVTVKPLKDFYISGNKVATQCKACFKFNREQKAKDPECMKKLHARQKICRLKREKNNVASVRSFLLKNPCSCGETDLSVLEFAYKQEFKGTVANGISKWSNSRLIKELESNIEVKCANCLLKSSDTSNPIRRTLRKFIAG